MNSSLYLVQSFAHRPSDYRCGVVVVNISIVPLSFPLSAPLTPASPLPFSLSPPLLPLPATPHMSPQAPATCHTQRPSSDLSLYFTPSCAHSHWPCVAHSTHSCFTGGLLKGGSTPQSLPPVSLWMTRAGPHHSFFTCRPGMASPSQALRA